jgi:hypothetical protein
MIAAWLGEARIAADMVGCSVEIPELAVRS